MSKCAFATRQEDSVATVTLEDGERRRSKLWFDDLDFAREFFEQARDRPTIMSALFEPLPEVSS